MKRYLPLWTDRYPTIEQQYDLGWIMESCKDDPRYSLLPIRYYGRGYVYEDTFYRSYSADRFYPEMTGKHWLRTEIIPARYFYAQALYKKAAEQIFEKYPQLSEVSFSQLTEDGVYPINWAVSYDVLLTEMKNAIKEVYEKGFYIDEFIDIEETFDEMWNAHKVRVSGTLIGWSAEISEWFYKSRPENYTTRNLKKHYRISLEKCYEYYRIFSEDELTLGNQPRKYAQNEKEFGKVFEAAEQKDFELLAEYARGGFDLNTIGSGGETVLSKFCECDKFTDYDKLDTLISLGANPALYGCEYNEMASPLWMACMNSDVRLVEYLLSKGVNPIIVTSTGEFGEFLIEQLERWTEETDCKRDDSHIIRLLKNYAQDTNKNR